MFFGKRRQPDLYGDAHVDVVPEIEDEYTKASRAQEPVGHARGAKRAGHADNGQ